jgi:membrane AbrB-like protein
MQLLRMAARGVPLQLAETLAWGALGGLVFEMLGLPAGLVSGSVLAVAIAALAGRPTAVPARLTRLVLVLVGIALGSVVTPETVRGLAAYPASIAVLTLGTWCLMAGTAWYLRTVHGWDGLSAVLGASPGALSQVMALAMEPGANLRGVAVVQTMRIVLLVGGLPLALTLLGFTGPIETSARAPSFDLLEFIVLVGVSAGSAALLNRVGFPGAWLFGAMIGSAVLHGGGFVVTHLPWWLTAGAMVALGAVTGSRFAGTPPRVLVSYLAAAFGSFAVSSAIAAVFMGISIALLPVRPSDLVIAFAPGAQETMMLLALALHLDPVFVGAHHLARFLAVSLTLPLLAGAAIRRRNRDGT